MTDREDSKYRWLIIVLASLTNVFVTSMPLMCMPVFFKDIAADFGLSLVQLGALWGSFGLAGFITSLAGGLISDRFGTKRTICAGCIMAGITGAMRGLSGGFIGLGITMFLFCFVMLTTVLNIHKLAGVWFSGKQVVIANGIVSAGVGMGAMLGAMISNTVLSPLLGGWQNVLIAYGAESVIFGLIWCMTRSEFTQKGSDQNGKNIPFRQAFSRVIRTGNVWILSSAHLCYMACIMGATGYLPLYLRNVGFSPERADGALAVLKGAGMVAVIPLAILSSKFALKKGMLIAIYLITMVSLYLLPLVSSTVLIWPPLILVGMLNDVYVAILLTMVMATRGIGSVYAGTAIGLVFSLGSIGGFFSPPVGNAVAHINPGLPFIFWGSFMIIAIALLYLPGRFKADTL